MSRSTSGSLPGIWNVQNIESLSNGYAIKYTTGIFRSAKGKMLDGVGLLPDLEVDMDEAASERAARAKDPAERVSLDSQLRVAINALRL